MSRVFCKDVCALASLDGKVLQGKVAAVLPGSFVLADASGFVVVSHAHELPPIGDLRVGIVLTQHERLTVFPTPLISLSREAQVLQLRNQDLQGESLNPVDWNVPPAYGLNSFVASYIKKSEDAVLVNDKHGNQFSVKMWTPFVLSSAGQALFVNVAVRENNFPPLRFTSHLDKKSGSFVFPFSSSAASAGVHLPMKRIDMPDVLCVEAYPDFQRVPEGKLISIKEVTVTSIKEAEVTVKGEKKRIQNVAARFPGPVLNEVSMTLWNPARCLTQRRIRSVGLLFFFYR